MTNSLYHGRRFRILNILDEGVHKALAIDRYQLASQTGWAHFTAASRLARAA